MWYLRIQLTQHTCRTRNVIAVASLLATMAACVPDAAGPDLNDIRFTVVSGSGQTGTVGKQLPTALKVRATNSSNQSIPNIYVNFEVVTGGGSVYAGSVPTDASGYAQDYWTLGPTTGAQSLEVRSINGTTGAKQSYGTFTATATPGVATKLVQVAGNQEDGYGGVALTVAPAVQVTDAYGNPKPGFSVSFAVASGGGSVSGTSGANVQSTVQSTASDGTARPSSWTLGGAPGINSLTASSGTLAGSPSTFFANALFSVKVIGSGTGHTCELRADGAVYCTGFNGNEELGAPGAGSGGVLRMISAASGAMFAQLAVGGSASCGVLSSGDALCWGVGAYGQLGYGGTSAASYPVRVGAIKFKSISVGSYHACGVSTSGVAYCWGSNNYGQLGDNTTTQRNSPVAVNTSAIGSVVFAQISAGGTQTCAVSTTGVGYCWGSNTYGQVGNGGTEATITPEQIIGNHVWRSASAGYFHSCAVTTGNVAYCWGANSNGQLGIGSTSNSANGTPLAVAGGLSIQQIQASSQSTCALTTSFKAYCWGANQYGQLADGTTTSRLSPTVVATGQLFSALGGSSNLTQCAVPKSGGAPWCWGANFQGQLGAGVISNGQTTPYKVLNP
jgi:alpha-tubulin suppressor-like RCC1 family protein